MAFSLVQAPTPTLTATVTSATLAFVSNVTKGNLLICYARAAGGGSPHATISDTLSGTAWTVINQPGSVGGDKMFWYKIANATGACTITVTSNPSTSGTVRIAALEYSCGGAVPFLDTQTTESGVTFVAGTAFTTQAISTTGDDLVVWGFSSGTNLTASAAAGYSTSQTNNANGDIVLAHNPLVGAGRVTTTITLSAGATGEYGIAAFGIPVPKPPPFIIAPGFFGPPGPNDLLGHARLVWGPAPTVDAAITVPRIGLNGIVSTRPWHDDVANPDGWYNTTAFGSSTIGKLNADADFLLFDKLLGGRALHLRFEVPWRWIESAQGVYDWSHLDYLVTKMMTRGLTPHAVIWASPAWVGASTTLPQPTQIYSFMTACVARYKRWGTYQGQPWGIRIWEPWNEPDGAHYGAFTGTQYTQNILNPSYDAVKSGDANALVVAAGQGAGPGAAWNAYVDAMLAANAQFDVMGWHDYPASNILNADYAGSATHYAGNWPSKPALWIDEFGNLDPVGTDIATWFASVYAPGAQTPPSPTISYYTIRDDNNVQGFGILNAALTAGTAVTSLTVAAGMPTATWGAIGDVVVLWYQAGDGVIHVQTATLSATYTTGNTLTITSLTPKYGFPVGTQVQAGSEGANEAPQPYGIFDRGGNAKANAPATFISFLTDQPWMAGARPQAAPPGNRAPGQFAKISAGPLERPLVWGSGGPVANTLTLSAALALVGSLTRSVGHSLTAATLSAAGSLTKSTARALSAGALTMTGSLARQGGKALSGSLTLVGTMAQRRITRGIAAALAVTGSQSRAVARTLAAASLMVAGTLTKATTRVVPAGTLQAAGTLARTPGKAFAAAVTLVGSIPSRAVAHGLSAGLTLAGSVGRATTRALAAGTISVTGTIGRATSRALAAAALSTVGTIGRRTAHTLSAGSLIVAGSVTRQGGKALSATLTAAGSLARNSVRTLSGALSSSATIRRATARLLAATTALSGAVSTVKNGGQHAFSQSLTATLVLAGSVQRGITRSLPAAALALTGTTQRAISRSLAGSISQVGSLRRATAHLASATLVSVGGVGRATAHRLTGTVATAGTLARGRFALLAAGLTSSGTIARSVGKSLAGTVTTTGQIGRGIGRALAAVLATVGSLLTSPFHRSSPGTVSVTLTLPNTVTAALTQPNTVSAELSQPNTVTVTLSLT